MQFFTLRVASNKEDRVREALVRKVKIEALEPQVGRILVPVERVRSIKDGKRRDTDRKLYPGYVFIELELDKGGMIPEKVWFTIKETDGVGDFIGSNGKPSPMTPKDQAKIIEAAERPDEPVSGRLQLQERRPRESHRRAVREFRGDRRRSRRRQGNRQDDRHHLRTRHHARTGILADRKIVVVSCGLLVASW
jgi:transcription antitermination factor NusG